MTEQQLPEGWKMVKFGDIAKHISKRVEPTETDLEVYVGLEHLDPDCLKIKRHGVPSDVAGQKLFVKKGQIIFGKRRAYQRKVAVSDWDCICSAHAMVIEANSERVVPEFLPFFMQSDIFMKRAVSISEGSLSPTIKWKTLENQNFLIPSINEQRKLVDVMASRVRTIDCIDKSLESAKASMRAMLQDVVCEKSTEKSIKESLPDGWILKKLKDVVSYRLGRAFPSADYGSEGIKLVRPGNLYASGKVEWSDRDTIYIPMTYKDENPDYVVYQNEIIMNLTAQSLDDGFLGRVCWTSEGEVCMLNQRLARLSPRDGVVGRYLFWALQSRLCREYLHRMPLGTKVKHLYNFELENIPLLIPESKEKQLQISKSLDLLAESIETLQVKKQELRKVSVF